MANLVRQRLPHDSRAPAVARRALDPLRPALAPDVVEELRLLVSELVTNAIRHGRRGVELAVSLDRRRARVEVIDGGGGFDPPDAPPDTARPDGWGLVVVDRLADRWGVESQGTTRVWLELDLPRGGGSWRAAHGPMNLLARASSV